jgi:pimeloyl-ACP methyl ester carboxylesterase
MEVRRADGSVIACEVVGEPGAAPVLLCHGLADSRLSARLFTRPVRELGLCVVAPDRPGCGRSDRRRLRRLVEWVEDAALVLDAVQADSAAVVGISGGGPFAAACAARLPGRVRSLMLVSPLGLPGWSTRGMAPGERVALEIARHTPAFGGWTLGHLAALARRSPTLIQHGDADITVPLLHARLFAELIPGTRLHVHPGQGHFSILDVREILATLAG